MNTELTLTILDEEYYIQCKLNSNTEPINNIEILILNTKKYKAYQCIFNESNISIQNVNLQGIYKMIVDSFDNNSNLTHSVKWNLENLMLSISYHYNIFTFEQVFHFNLVDNIIPNINYQLYSSKQEIKQLKQTIYEIKNISNEPK